MFKPEFHGVPATPAAAGPRPPAAGGGEWLHGGTRDRVLAAGFDGVVAAGLLTAANRLGGWQVAGPDLGALLGICAVVFGAGEFLRGRGFRKTGGIELVAGLIAAGLWNWLGLDRPLSAGRFAYGFALVTLAVAGWRMWRRRGASMRAEPVAEPLRVLLVLAGAGYVMWPMFVDRNLGGTDARWYGYMLKDFIDQWRSGPVVLIGQGDLAWNGAIHPFRSAPVYMHVAGVWDWLTARALEIPALQHLAAITAALAAAAGIYASGVKLAPRRRWESAGIAVLYVTSPALLMPIYGADAYMTYVAGAAFTWAFHGNARILAEGRGWLALAAGLSLAWMCHPPTAMQVMLLTVLLQAGGLACGCWGWRDWRKVAVAAAAFALLSLYYFTGMSELPKSPEFQLRTSLLQVVALVAGWLVAGRVIVMRREWGWALLLVPVALILWSTNRCWMAWLGLTGALLAALGLVTKPWRGRWDPADHAPLVLAGAVILAAGIMDQVIRAGWMQATGYPAQSVIWSQTWSVNYFKPLTPLLNTHGDFQPGWGLLVAGAAAGIAAVRRRAFAAQLVVVAAVGMSLLVVPWGRFADFMLGFFPHHLIVMTGMAMPLRTMPVIAALLAAGGLLAVREAQAWESRRARAIIGAILAGAVLWSAWQARFVVHRGLAVTATTEGTAKDWRTENAVMDRFVYDLLPIPPYFSHGKSDPRLEVRLLDDDGKVLYGPTDIAAAMEADGARVLELTAHAMPGTDEWLRLEPGFTLQPGEEVLLRFEFDPARTYNGYLLFKSEHGYREYYLPESGLPRAFGSGPEQAKVLSLWNSGAQAENYSFQVIRKPGNDLSPGMAFGRVFISQFHKQRARLHLDYSHPWRAQTRLDRPGQLETPRVFLPGYRAKVDGRWVEDARIGASPNKLLQVSLPAGEHVVELRYPGTVKLRLAGLVSLAAWAGLLAWFLFRRRVGPVAGF